MRGIIKLTIPLALVAALVVAAIPAMAAKPPDVILKSNGFPSGLHFNLNIHGKNESFECTNISGGGSIFIDEYGPATIQYTINKRSSLETLEVVDGCAIDGGMAEIQLPWKIRDDEGILHDADGYYAYARIRAKPQNGKDTPPSSIVVGKHRVVNAGDVLNPDGETILLPLGLFTSNRLYLPEGNVFERWEDPNATGKGKAKAQNMTPLFMWSGWIIELDDQGTASSLDIATSTNGSCSVGDGDGVIDDCDVPANAKDQINTYHSDPDAWQYYENNYGTNDSMDDPNDIDQIEEWLAFQAVANPQWVTYVEDWIWNIAQLVITEQDIYNDGSKLLQVRFYPVSTTEFTEKAHIVIKKVTEPSSDLITEFDFNMTGPGGTTSFSLKNSQSTLFGEIEELIVPGIYTVTETVPAGWQLDTLIVPDDISDPSGDSVSITNGAEIHLAAGETVIATFTNKSASLEILKEDELGNPLAGSTFTITPDPRTGIGSLEVIDNGSNDADPYPGVLLVTGCMISVTDLYTVHEQDPPDGYVAAADQSTTIPSFTKVQLTFTNSPESLTP